MSERKRYRTASLLMAAGIGAGAMTGCAESDDVNRNVPHYAIEVTNTSGQTIDIGGSRSSSSPASRIGTIEANEKAWALCLTAGSDIPKNMGLRVKRDSNIGYISLFSADGKDTPGQQQLTPGYDELRLLPLCNPPVKAALKAEAGVHTIDGQINLQTGTLATAECVSNGNPFTLRAKIESGPYDGQTADDLPRDALEATNDPYGASVQNPAADPFGPLPPCNEL